MVFSHGKKLENDFVEGEKTSQEGKIIDRRVFNDGAKHLKRGKGEDYSPTGLEILCERTEENHF